MKPSERIKELHSNIFMHNSEAREAAIIKAIFGYLDEDAEKSKYACPNCHRVVDRLINISHLGGNVWCEYCMNANSGEKYGNV